MIFLRHVARLVLDLGHFGVVTGRAGILIALLVGLALVAVVWASAAAAPVVLYPFG